jgi:hypothetical protein
MRAILALAQGHRFTRLAEKAREDWEKAKKTSQVALRLVEAADQNESPVTKLLHVYALTLGRQLVHLLVFSGLLIGFYFSVIAGKREQ